MRTLLLVCALVGCTVLASAALAEDQAFDCVMDPSLRVNVGSSIPGLLDAVWCSAAIGCMLGR
jgi:hypothetical protein